MVRTRAKKRSSLSRLRSLRVSSASRWRICSVSPSSPRLGAAARAGAGETHAAQPGPDHHGHHPRRPSRRLGLPLRPHPEPRRPGRPRHPLRPLRHRRADHPAQPRLDPHRPLPAAPRRARQRHLRARRRRSRPSPSAWPPAATTPRRWSRRWCWRAARGWTRASASTTTTSAPATPRGRLVSERTAERRPRPRALRAMAGLKAPFFLWVHYYDPHEEYRPPTRFADAARGPHRLYDGEIAFMDEQIGELLKKLPAGTDVLAVGDHGEMLGEHGEATHGLLLYRAARRVPLLLAGPDIPAGKVSDCLVRTVDVTPTLLALAGAPAATAALDGRGLLPLRRRQGLLARDLHRELPPLLRLQVVPAALAGRPTASSISRRRRAASTTSPPIPARARDLAPAQAKAGAGLGGEAGRLPEGDGGEARHPGAPRERALRRAAPPARQPRLPRRRGLGAGHRASCPIRAPWPASPRTSTASPRRSRRGTATRRCRSSRRSSRRTPTTSRRSSLAGFCLQQAGRTESALDLFQRAREGERHQRRADRRRRRLPARPRPQGGGRAEYRRALALDPAQAVGGDQPGAAAAREGGHARGASEVLDTALRAGAHEPEIFLERGVARAETGNLEGALADFREAARRAPANPVPLENAARTAYDLKRFRDAALLYEQLLRLAPNRGRPLEDRGRHLSLRAGRQARRPCAASAAPSSWRAIPAEHAKLEALVKELGG